MKADGGTLTALAGNFALMSLLAVGGGNAAVPEMHRLAVDVMGWMTDRQFTEMFAIAQVTPGPNVIIVTLIGYHVAGLLGAVITTAAMCGPTCLFAFYFARVWDRFKDRHWRMDIQTAVVPLSIGLIAASAFVVARAADYNFAAFAVTAATAAIVYLTKVNPLWLFAVAGAMGLLGFL